MSHRYRRHAVRRRHHGRAVRQGGTPAPLIARLNEAVTFALNDDAVRGRLAELGRDHVATTPEHYIEMLKSDEANVMRLVQSGLLKPE